MSFKSHREKLYELLPQNSLVVSYAGIPIHTNEDDYYNFEVNSQYFYLTGLERENTAFTALKTAERVIETLFIEEPDELNERWTGKMPTKEEVREISDEVCGSNNEDGVARWLAAKLLPGEVIQ